MSAPPAGRLSSFSSRLAVLRTAKRHENAGGAAGALRIVERNAVAWRGLWLLFLSMLVEPAFFLLSIGVGVGTLVGDVTLPSGSAVPYRVFVGGGMLASSAMFGPVFDTTFGFFIRLKYAKLYDGVLATPLAPVDIARGELGWAILRGAIYSAFFLATMVVLGFVRSWWAVLAVPAAALIGYAFAATGLAATTWMRSFVDFDWVNAALLPLFLFSTIFFPLSRYPVALQWIVQVTPLYQGVVLERALVLGEVDWWSVPPALYLLVLGTVSLAIAGRRMRLLLQA
jgi:lipooligosaccharide transport system permease protein